MTQPTQPSRPPMFNAGADSYENLSPSLWNPLGNALASAADLVPGERVLDVCCGAGASAIPAAQEVGPSGRVTGVDLSDALVDLAREKARWIGLNNTEFVVEDVNRYVPEDRPDAVLMGLGIFLLPEPSATMRHLRGILAPGGRFALSTWANPGLQPLLEPFFQSAKRHNPRLAEVQRPRSFSRIERAADPEETRSDLLAAGFTEVETSEIRLKISMDESLLWDFVRGTGLRTMLSDTPAVNQRIREEFAEATLENDYFEFSATVNLHVASLAV